jgi:hypothetical protein
MPFAGVGRRRVGAKAARERAEPQVSGEPHLTPSPPPAGEKPRDHWHAEPLADRSRQEEGLVIASPVLAPPVEGHRHDDIGARQRARSEKGPDHVGHPLSERSTQVVHSLELETVHQTAHRAGVVGGPDDGPHGAGAQPHAGRPSELLPAGRTNASRLAPGQGCTAEKAVGGKDNRQRRLD